MSKCARSIQYSLLILLISLLSCKKEQENSHATIENISESVYASGIIKSKNQYQVFSTVNGLIEKKWVSEGDFVKKGAPLFVIFNEASKLNSENAQLAVNFANVNNQADKLNELELSISTANNKLQSDSLSLLRQKNLWAQDIGTKVQLEQMELSYKNAISTYQAAIYRYNELKKQLVFTSSQSKKSLSISKNVEKDYTVRSQMDGRVYSVLKEQGEMVNAQSPLLVIGDAKNFLIELQVDEADIARIKIGQKVLMTLDSYKGVIFEAKVDKINPSMNDKSRTFMVESSFVNNTATLYPNLTTEANIIIETKENALTILRSYLIADSFVLLANQEKRKVRVGLKDYQKVEIVSGITTNDVLLKPLK